MLPPRVFLRTGTVLPKGFEISQEIFAGSWSSVLEETGHLLESRLRTVGWHFMWLMEVNSSRSYRSTEESAVRRATLHALTKIDGRFNAAELGAVKVRRFPWFTFARVTVHTRQLQHAASLGLVDELLQASPQPA